MKKLNIRSLILASLMMLSAMSIFAVTQKEMEQARVITAKAYLRYANDGSGYLDDVKVSSMSELEKALKPKEKENLKAFKAVKVPGDYASWDKEKLTEFWAVTFFTSPGLQEKGKIAKSRVRKQIQAMNIAAPAPEAKPEAPAPEPAPLAEPMAEAAPADSMPTAAEAVQAQQDILADQKAIQEDTAAAQSLDQEQSHTWVYVAILIILIGVVIWLVVYAAKVMKRQENAAAMPEYAAADGSAPSGEALAALNATIEEQEQTIRRLREENTKLARSRETARSLDEQLNEARRIARGLEEQRNEARRAAETVRAAEVPAKEALEPRKQEILKVIYLGRANSRGIFVRADRRVSPGNTVFRLDTEDGLVGTFHVVDLPVVTRIALDAPQEYLAGACTADDIDDSIGATGIVTESAGTAIFENGYWKVLRKSRIRYE